VIGLSMLGISALLKVWSPALILLNGWAGRTWSTWVSSYGARGASGAPLPGARRQAVQ